MAPETPAGTPAPLSVLLDNHRAFLGYLERRVGDRALAEDILQDAFARTLARPEQAPEGEALVPWFYRTLRNAAIDREVCQCISRLATTLKPDYAEALQAIEVEGQPVTLFAERKGLTAGNAAVRVFRAREALKRRVVESCGTCAEHGCLDCTCQAAV
jgi:RNA polymerase sigma-70 factor (ECF subfamily)